MNSGISYQEVQKLFTFLEQSKTNDSMTILIDNSMCKELYNIIKLSIDYQKMLESRIDKSLKYIEKHIKDKELPRNYEYKIRNILNGEEND